MTGIQAPHRNDAEQFAWSGSIWLIMQEHQYARALPILW